MNSLTSFLIKKKAKKVFQAKDEKQGPEVGEIIKDLGSEAKDKCSQQYKNTKGWFKNKVKGPECQDRWCHQKLEDNLKSKFCKYHRCHKCIEKRAKGTIFCSKHSI